MPQIRYLITFRGESSIISVDSNISSNITGRSLMYNWKNVGTKMDPQSVNCQIIVGAIRPQLGKRVLACPNVGDLGGGGGGGGVL